MINYKINKQTNAKTTTTTTKKTNKRKHHAVARGPAKISFNY